MWLGVMFAALVATSSLMSDRLIIKAFLMLASVVILLRATGHAEQE